MTTSIKCTRIYECSCEIVNRVLVPIMYCIVCPPARLDGATAAVDATPAAQSHHQLRRAGDARTASGRTRVGAGGV